MDEKSLKVFEDFYFRRNFIRFFLTVLEVTPINDAISLNVIDWGKSEQHSLWVTEDIEKIPICKLLLFFTIDCSLPPLSCN